MTCFPFKINVAVEPRGSNNEVRDERIPLMVKRFSLMLVSNLNMSLKISHKSPSAHYHDHCLLIIKIKCPLIIKINSNSFFQLMLSLLSALGVDSNSSLRLTNQIILNPQAALTSMIFVINDTASGTFETDLSIFYVKILVKGIGKFNSKLSLIVHKRLL